MDLAFARPPKPPHAERRAWRPVVGGLTTLLLVVGLVGLPGTTLAFGRSAPVSSIASEVDDLAAQPSEPSRDLDPARVAAILGVGASALSAGILVLLELRRHRARSARHGSGDAPLQVPAPADLDALVAGIREHDAGVSPHVRPSDTPVWVARLDAEIDADTGVDVGVDLDEDTLAPFIDRTRLAQRIS